MPELVSGAVYKRPYDSEFVLIYNDHIKEGGQNVARYGMLYICRHDQKGMSCPMLQHGRNGEVWFTENQLRSDFNLDDWIVLDGRLRIEKIDPLMSFVEYSNGNLEKYNSTEELCHYLDQKRKEEY